MIDEKIFLEYKLEQEKRVSKLEQELLLLKKDLKMQEMRHRLELQELKNAQSAPMPIPAPTPESKEEKNDSADLLLQYSEDAETLKKLGFNLKEGGN